MAKTKEKALENHDGLAIMSSADAASEMLGLNSYEDPAVVLEAIERFLKVFDSDATKSTLGPTETAMALGSLWGNTLLVAYDWTWIRVNHGDWESLGVVDAERKYLALPYQLFEKLLSKSSDPSMAGPYARFNAIGANNLPAARPNSYLIITG